MITKEHIEQAKRDTIQIFDDLLANFEEEKYAFIKDAYWEDAKIVVEFETNVDIDIRYWFGDKIHEVEDYVDKIDHTKGIYRIGVNQFDKYWNVQLIGEVESEVVNVGPYQKPESPEQSLNKLNIFTGFWYSNDVPDSELKQLMTAGHSREANYKPLKEIVDYGHKAVPTIGGFSKDDFENELRQRVRDRKQAFEKIGYENIEFVILDDEPRAKGLSVNQLEIIVDEFQNVFPDLRCTFMFTESSVRDKEYPDNLELIGFNAYPFYHLDAPQGYPKVTTYEEFEQYMDSIIDTDKQLVISPQAFETKQGASNTNPWRMPPVESSEYYFRYASDKNIIGFLIWMKGELSKWNGMTPELEAAWVESMKKWVK